MNPSELTAKQKKAIEYFVECGQKAKAYKDAYDGNTDSSHAIREMNKILDKPEGQEYLALVRKQYIDRIGNRAEFIMKQLVEDIEWRGEKGGKSATWAKSIDLLQKQLGLQSQKVDLAAQNEININIVKESDYE